jgi:PAS domain S-box-containing protein
VHGNTTGNADMGAGVAPRFPVHEGEMGRLIRDFDWSTTKLGPIENWPQSLKTSVELALAAPVPIVMLFGDDGTLIYNDGYRDFAGKRHPQILGAPVVKAWPEVAEFNQHVMDTCLAGGTLSPREMLMVLNRQGQMEDVWLDLDYSPIRDESGKPFGVFVTVIEITKRLLAERALRAREADLARAQQIGGVGGVEVDLISGFKNRRSPEYLTIHGLPPEAANETHEDWVRRIHPDDRERTEKQFLDAIKGDIRDYTSEYRIIRPNDGKERWISVRAQIERDEKGIALRLVGTHIDVTDRKRIENALREETHALEILNRTGAQIAAEHDLNTVVQAVIDAGVALTGAQFGAFFFNVIDDKGERYTLYNLSGVPREKFEKFPMPRNTKVFEPTFTGAGVVRSDDILADPRYGQNDTYHGMPKGHLPVRSYLAVPVIARNGEVLGGLFFGHENTGIFTERSERLMSGLAGEAAVAIDNNRLFQDAQRELKERRLTEKALRESEERFRLIANSAPVPMWVSELGGTRAFVNLSYQEFLGVSYEEGLVYDWRKSIHPDDIPRILKEQVAGESSKKPFALEMRVRNAQGEWRWVRSQSQPRWSPTGEHIGFIGVAHDITASKQAETRLRSENLALEDTVAQRTRERDRIWSVSQDLLVVADSSGVWKQINPAWTSALGWSEKELLNRTSEWLEHPEDRTKTRAEVERLARGERTLRFENRYRHKDGSYRWLSWTAVPDEGLILATARDISAEKEAEEALRRTEEALRQSQKMEAVGQLTGGIAHDFNNLLQGIVGSLDLVKKRVTQGRIHEIDRFVSGAMTSANRAAALTHRLLAFSRRQPLAPKACSVNDVLNSMEDLLRRSMGEQIWIEFNRADDAALTYCDHNQLENAILNLAINARDAMPDGGKLIIATRNVELGNVSSSAELDVPTGQYLEIAVSDTGTGMAPDVVERAFEPFYTTKPLGQGTGLGLSMIYGFARQSDGTVVIRSELGAGTTVSILLPKYDGASEVSKSESPQGLTDVAGHSEIVLVVEDEAIVRGLIVEVLDELGYKAIEAADGPSGLEILQSSRKIDMLITDIGLPGLNGRQIADAALIKRPDLKILFMTGYAENAALANGVLDSSMEMITKPFAMEDLGKRIREIIER